VTVDDMLADPLAALELPDGSIPVSIVLLVEYVNPGSDNMPAARRLAVMVDEDMSPWTTLGMLRYAAQLELDAVKDRGADDGADDE